MVEPNAFRASLRPAPAPAPPPAPAPAPPPAPARASRSRSRGAGGSAPALLPASQRQSPGCSQGSSRATGPAELRQGQSAPRRAGRFRVSVQAAWRRGMAAPDRTSTARDDEFRLACSRSYAKQHLASSLTWTHPLTRDAYARRPRFRCLTSCGQARSILTYSRAKQETPSHRKSPAGHVTIAPHTQRAYPDAYDYLMRSTGR